MIMKMHHKLLWLMILLSACQSSDLAFSLPSEWSIALRQALCSRLARCGSIGKSELFDCQSEAQARPSVYPTPYSYDKAVRENRMKFDLTAARSCIKLVRDLGCTSEEFDQLLATDCDFERIFEGNVALQMSCENSFECIVGYCKGPNGPVNAGCSGTCQNYIITNSTCSPEFMECHPRNYCDINTHKCTPRNISGQSCRGNLACSTGLLCKGYVPTTSGQPEQPGTCLPPGQVGEVCSILYNGSFDCVPGLFCDRSQAPRRCARRKPQDAACRATYECQDGLACAGARRQSNNLVELGHCVPFLDSYEDCSGSDFSYFLGGGPTGASSSACPADMHCSPTTPSCGPLGTGWGYCVADADNSFPEAREFFSCSYDYYCDFKTNRCLPKHPLGTACNQADSPDNVCAYSVCNPTTATCQAAC